MTPDADGLDMQVTTSSGKIHVKPAKAAVAAWIRGALEQSLEIVRRRVDETGVVEPTIMRQGTDRLLIQLPGVQDPGRIKALLGTTAKMTFHLLEDGVARSALQRGARLPPGVDLLPGSERGNNELYPVKRRAMLEGDRLVDAGAGFDQRTGEPVVNFRFDSRGAQRFAEVTRANVGKPFAIVLDGKVLSAPVIREPITGGQGQISGSFTVQAANDLAILLRAGALPAPLTVIEERTVGPGLGQDSIEKGELAAYVGSIMVIVFMLLTYRLFGVFANIAVAINVAMIFGLLSLLNATLTLPGIAGIVLTVGIAVDSNVLIYERIREELRGGRNAISAIDAGFKRALATILDSNITTFIAAAVLFYIGTGPVRGFAVTLGIGIITTVFTAFTLTRLIVAGWVRWKRPQSVPI
jgi:preprotein translocase subunit SecD